EKARNPSMAVFIFNLGAAVLAAHGLDAYGLGRRTVWILAGLGGILSLLLLVLVLTKVPADDRLGMTALIALLLAGLLYGWKSNYLSAQTAGLLVTLLMLLELGNVTPYSFPHREQATSLLKKLTEHSDIAKFLQSREDLIRVEIDDQEVPYNFGDWYGIEHFGGYLAS